MAGNQVFVYIGRFTPEKGPVFRFNRRTAKSIAHRFARLIEQAVLISPTTYRAISHGIA